MQVNYAICHHPDNNVAWVPAKLLPAQSDLVGKVGLAGLSPENTIYRTGAVRTNQIVRAGFIR